MVISSPRWIPDMSRVNFRPSSLPLYRAPAIGTFKPEATETTEHDL